MTSDEQLLETQRILNEPGMAWKVRLALLIHKVGLSEYVAKTLVPEPIGDFHPGDY